MSLESGSSHGGDGGSPSPGGEGVGGVSPGSGGLESGADQGGMDNPGGPDGTDGTDGAGSFGGFEGGIDSGVGDGGMGVGFEGGADFGGGFGGELGDTNGFGAMDAAPFAVSSLDKTGQTDGEETDQSDESVDPGTEQTTGQATTFFGTELSGVESGKTEQGSPTAVAETRSGAAAFKTEVGTPAPTETGNPARPAEVNPGKPEEMPTGRPGAFDTTRPAEIGPAGAEKRQETGVGNPFTETRSGAAAFKTEVGTPATPETGNSARPAEVNPGRPDEMPAGRSAEFGAAQPAEAAPAKPTEIGPKDPAEEAAPEARPEPERPQPAGQPDRQPQELTPGPVDPARPMMSETTGGPKPEQNDGAKPEGDKPADKTGATSGDGGDKPGGDADAGDDAPKTRKEAVERRIEDARRQRDETLIEHYKDDPETLAEMRRLVERNDRLTKPYYDESVETAKHAKAIENFSDHNKAHISEVTTGVLKNAEELHKMEEEQGLPPGARVDDKVLVSAAQWHDVGMAGSPADRKALADDPDASLDGDRIRVNHSYESGMAILEHQDEFDTPDQAFETALVTYLHSKSNSGVPSLGDKQAVIDAANRLNRDYESRGNGRPGFDLSRFGKVNEDGTLVDLDPEVQTRIGNEALVLRVADAQRPAGDTPTTMTGRVMESEKVRYEDPSGFSAPLGDELVDQKVEYLDPEDPDGPRDKSTGETALKFANGERNVDAGTMRYTADGTLEVSYVVRDAYVDQAATREILNERMREAESAPAAKDAPPGSITREQISHVVRIEKGDEAARAELERVLNAKEFGASYYTKNGEPVHRTVRVELKQ